MASTPATPAATVLVVDDNDANRSLARHTLEDEGYRARILPALPSTFDLWQELPEYFVGPPEPEPPADGDETWNPLHDG